MKKILSILMVLMSLNFFGQINKYTVKVDGVNETNYKFYYEELRKPFNTIHDPFKFVLTFNDIDDLFTIESDLEVSQLEIEKMCNRLNLNLLLFTKTQ